MHILEDVDCDVWQLNRRLLKIDCDVWQLNRRLLKNGKSSEYSNDDSVNFAASYAELSV
jgi:hypothetical protein